MFRQAHLIILLSLLTLVQIRAEDESTLSHVLNLDADTFTTSTSHPTKGSLVAFVASWCGHCKRLKPVYEKLAQAFSGDDNVQIAMIDADKHRSIGEKYKVAGFPTIKWFEKGGQGKVVDYNGGRSLKELIGFVNEKAGTVVSEDGSSSGSAGVIQGLTDKIKALISAEEGERAKLMTSIKEYGASLDASARENFKYYEKILSKYASDGAEYVIKEKNRIMKILKDQANNLMPNQKKSFMQRLNVLNIFSKEEL